ncbi:MAG: hypothetical protein SGJ27_17390 [Candidatus Melainabacteria bacterium]|nr:hypothetical protein [Candidatus Melainabacteria bacterium]
MSRIAVDMDEVITDALTKHVHLYNQHFGKQTTFEDLAGKSLPEFAEEHERQQVIDFVMNEEFFQTWTFFPARLKRLRLYRKSMSCSSRLPRWKFRSHFLRSTIG